MAGKHGGARPNSGPDRKPPAKLTLKNKEKPLEFLLAVMNDPEADAHLRVRAAVAAAQYIHTKKSDGGKKDEKKSAAQVASEGRFSAAAPPRLVVSNK